MDTQRVAYILKLGADKREASYNKEDQRYELSPMEACVEIADSEEKEIAWLIGLALDGWWNDALDWANNPHS